MSLIYESRFLYTSHVASVIQKGLAFDMLHNAARKEVFVDWWQCFQRFDHCSHLLFNVCVYVCVYVCVCVCVRARA